MNCNKTVGNRFEARLCEMLAEDGFWAHNMAQKSEGQPADVIAVKGGKAHLIDCKVCSENSFILSRIEVNQHSAMETYMERHNSSCWFCLYLNKTGEIYFVHYNILLNLQEAGEKRIRYDQIRDFGAPYERWVTER